MMMENGTDFPLCILGILQGDYYARMILIFGWMFQLSFKEKTLKTPPTTKNTEV